MLYIQQTQYTNRIPYALIIILLIVTTHTHTRI